MAANKYKSFISALFKSYQASTNYHRVGGFCRVMDVTEGRVKVEFDVIEELTNPFGTLHGGCSATLFDIVTTTALLATPRALPGVTVDLNVSCLSSGKIGETMVIDAEVVKAGRSIAFTKALMYRKSDNSPIATAMHTKSFIGARVPPKDDVHSPSS